MRAFRRSFEQRSHPRRPWSRYLTWAGTFVCLLAPPLASQVHPPHVAIILDRESPRFQPLVDAFQREVLGFFRPGEITLLPPVSGDGTASSISSVVGRVLRDSSVSIVV